MTKLRRFIAVISLTVAVCGGLFALEWPRVYRAAPGEWAVDYDGACYNLRFVLQSAAEKTVEVVCSDNVRIVAEHLLAEAVSGLLQSAGVPNYPVKAADYAADKLVSHGYAALCD
jgi:hypothetical protein